MLVIGKMRHGLLKGERSVEDNCREIASGDDASTMRGGGAAALPFGTPTAIQAFVLFLLSDVCFETWEDLLFVSGAEATGPVPFETNLVFFLVKSVALLLLAALSRRRPSLSFASAPFVGAIAVLLGFSTLASVLPVLGLASRPWLPAMAIGGGSIGMAMLTLAWFQVASALRAPAVLLCYLAASIVSPLPMAVCYRLAPEPIAAVAIALVLAATICLAWGERLANANLLIRGCNEFTLPSSLWRVYLLLAVFGFVFGLREPLLGSGAFESGSNSALGSILIAAVVLLGTVFKGSRFDFAFLFRIVLPLTAVAFLILPLNFSPTKEISDLCSAAVLGLTRILAVALFAYGGVGRCSNAVWFIGATFGLSVLSCSVGKVVCWLTSLSVPGAETLSSYFGVIAAAAIALTILVIPDRAVVRGWGLDGAAVGIGDSADTHGEAPASPACEAVLPLGVDPQSVRCHEFAKTYGLTPREEEVMVLLLSGKTGPEIEKELCVSRETVKSHRRNIYAKAQVHSREELESMLQAFANRYRTS